MILRKLKNKPHVTLQIGLALLALANIFQFLNGRLLAPGTDPIDFFNGVLMGISIAMLMLSIVLKRKRGDNA